MSDIIHLLPDHIANQIAAGEVIQRPASVVKELMENAVDAGAQHITVNIKDAGRTLIQVIDNGKGMSETDARMAFERHATSKIATVDDLFSLQTMGFRGEALASIAAVAQVELRTKTKGADIGVSLSISGSILDTVMPEACNEGCIFSVKNLFYNVPARRKFLKSNETEFQHIIAEFERIALVHPQIAFTLRHNESVIFELPVSGLKQRIITMFGKGMNQKLLSVEAETSLVHVTGFTARPDTSKKRGCRQYFFVNGRYMRHPYFHKAVIQAYEQMIPAGEMPDYFIYFSIPPSSIDVNIHPTKTEIKFENERAVWQIICSSIREALAKTNAIPPIDFDAAGTIDIPVYNPSQTPNTPPSIQINKSYNPFQQPTDWKTLFEDFESERSSVSLPIEKDNATFGKASHFAPVPADLQSTFGEASRFVNPADLQSDQPTPTLFPEFLHPCFQYKNRYIITPLKSGLCIIDQHRAHVRILFERYKTNIQCRRAVSQKLLFHEMLELTASESSLLSSLNEEIMFLGFDLAHLGGNTFAIHATPVEMCGNPVEHIKNIISAAMESLTSEKEKLTDRLALSLAKSTAIRAGKALSPEEMETMIASLFALEANGITPDGLPILTILTDEELANRI